MRREGRGRKRGGEGRWRGVDRSGMSGQGIFALLVIFYVTIESFG